MIKISVVIPCYNVANSIEASLQSIWRQKGMHDIEIVIIDDCSTDNTLKVIERLQNIHSLVLEKNIKNRGVSYSRNRGIELATGDLLLFLDADDLYKEELFDSLTNQHLILPNVDMIAFGYLKESPNGNKAFLANQFHLKTFTGVIFLKLFLTRQIKQCMCSFAVRRSMVIEHNIRFDEKIFSGEDQEFQMKCIIKCRQINYFSEVLFVYKYANNSFMNQKFQPLRLTSLQVYTSIYKELVSNDLVHFSKYLNTYSTLEFFSVLKYICKYGDNLMIENILDFNEIVYKKGYFNFDKQCLIVVVLKLWFRLHIKSLICFLKK